LVVVAFVIVAFVATNPSIFAFTASNQAVNKFDVVALVIVAFIAFKFSDTVEEAFTIPNVEVAPEDAFVKLIPDPDQVIIPFTFDNLLEPM
jgi:formate/nitrite transporter FocA (FNT family)